MRVVVRQGFYCTITERKEGRQSATPVLLLLLYTPNNHKFMIITGRRMSGCFLPGIPDGRTVFELRADISVIGHFFNFCIAGLYISFDKFKRVFFAFPVMLFMWGDQF